VEEFAEELNIIVEEFAEEFSIIMEEFAEEFSIILEEFAEELIIIVEEFYEEFNIIVEEFAVSLQQPAEISKCVSHIRDRTRDCISLKGVCFESLLNLLRKVHMNGDFA